MNERKWPPSKINAVLREAEYLKTCPTGDPWSAIHMKARMEDLAEIVKELRLVHKRRVPSSSAATTRTPTP